jgi:hypothetical protein
VLPPPRPAHVVPRRVLTISLLSAVAGGLGTRGPGSGQPTHPGSTHHPGENIPCTHFSRLHPSALGPTRVARRVHSVPRGSLPPQWLSMHTHPSTLHSYRLTCQQQPPSSCSSPLHALARSQDCLSQTADPCHVHECLSPGEPSLGFAQDRRRLVNHGGFETLLPGVAIWQLKYSLVNAAAHEDRAPSTCHPPHFVRSS